MEKHLKCVFMLSLKEMMLRRVAALLSNVCKYPDPITDLESWLNIHEDKVKYKISKLLLPESLREEMIDKVRPLSFEIREWLSKHELNQILLGEIGFEKLFWTSAGTINYKKTAEALLGCEALDVDARYRLACLDCLEDYIPLLWEELAEDKKEYFLNKTSFRPCLTFCWPRILKGEFSVLDRLWKGSVRNLTSFNQWAFEDSARVPNKTAAEYFFLKLTHEEREVSVMRAFLLLSRTFCLWFYSRSPYNVLHCLLSLMTHEQQMEVIKDRPVDVLLCFFVMPWQDLFVENTDIIWPFLPASGYHKLSDRIVAEVEFDGCLPKSFREFFITSPLEYKKYFVHENEYRAYRLLNIFIMREDSDSIECIFRNLDAADRAAIVFNPLVLDIFRRGEEDKRRMVEVCLREARLSKEDRERLKKECPDLRRVIEELIQCDC